MALWADELLKTRTKVDGQWVISRPIPGPLWSRVKDAWLVVRAKAEAVRFAEPRGWPPIPRPLPDPPPPPAPPTISDPGRSF